MPSSNLPSCVHSVYYTTMFFTPQFPYLHLGSTTADENTAPISTTVGALIGIILALVLVSACALCTMCIYTYLRQKSLKEAQKIIQNDRVATEARGDLQQTVSYNLIHT